MVNKSKSQIPEHPVRPPQQQDRQPGREDQMRPLPRFENSSRHGSGRLSGRVALVTGGDSGIGRAVSLAFAREGADVAIIFLEEEKDAQDTAALIKKKGRRAMVLQCDVSVKSQCHNVVDEVIREFGQLDVLVNNAAEQHVQESILGIPEDQLVNTFRTNIFSMFFMTAAALPCLKKSTQAAIINTSSVTAYRGSPTLLDYSATKGAIVSFTRSLAEQLLEDNIRVNGVAPGPIWTPLIPASFAPDEVATFGSDSPMGRAGEPWECAECYVFLASADSNYMTGQMLHPNGGEIING
jgi:NAD(P)-dependent dehydrogenase (short-subunit alcohol dehydrogenase family)